MSIALIDYGAGNLHSVHNALVKAGAKDVAVTADPDVVARADRIVLPYKPRVVVMYAGDNDIAKGTTPEQVAQHFEQFVAKLEKALPETKIVYVAIKPSIKRWNLIDKVRDANSRIRKVCDSKRQLEFVDIDPPMLGDDGQPRPELFAKDGLHLSDDGYKLWTSLVQPHLK